MAAFTTYAAWVLTLRERESWRRHRKLDVRMLGWFWTVGAMIFLWIKLATWDPSGFRRLAVTFGIVLLYFFVPDDRLEPSGRAGR